MLLGAFVAMEISRRAIRNMQIVFEQCMNNDSNNLQCDYYCVCDDNKKSILHCAVSVRMCLTGMFLSKGKQLVFHVLAVFCCFVCKILVCVKVQSLLYLYSSLQCLST